MVGRDPAKEARRHVEQIRQENGLGDGNRSNRHIQNLENALAVLSEQLYKKSTHFLLELIQNADDNEYDLVSPEINLTYRDRHLRIDCNERGFSPRNVEAICRVGDSTKTGSKGATGYVGEKGIGFKSVFTVADVVWISSREYSFKFDKSKPLGMIAPIWERFPEEVKPGYTSMLLQLSRECNAQEVIDELSSLDPRMLMFLRRLKQINVHVRREDRSIWSSRLHRTDGMVQGERAVQLIHDDKVMQYLVTKHVIKGLPPDPKRAGITESEILLAFPIGGDDGLDPEPQQVYAFLPVTDYGFKFLLHADWLLAASREDILASSPWNKHLRTAFVEAFIAVAKKCRYGFLQHTWPRYLPIVSSGQSFLEPARKDILTLLKMEAVLQSHGEQLAMPSTLIFVPEDFTDLQGVPMTLWSGTERRYLSSTYLASDFDFLKELGVKKMTPEMFLEDLSTFVRLNTEEFRHGKSAEWHRRLAEVLVKFTLEERYSVLVSRLDLIPLSNGSWISSSDIHVFLPPDGESCEIPGGLTVHQVSTEAAHDHTRRLLFSSLGIPALSVNKICRVIAETHRSPEFDAATVSRHDLVSQIAFLFHANWRNTGLHDFWFVTENDTRGLGSRLYLDSDLPLSATMFFADHRERFQFAHSSYLSAVQQGDKEWILWLCRNARLSLLPRLVQVDLNSSVFDMSADFKFVTSKFRSSEWLLLFRNHWNDYAAVLDKNHVDYEPHLDKPFRNQCRDRLRANLGSLIVSCRGDRSARLNQTYLPTSELIAAAKDYVAFLDVPEPDDPRWAKLELLDVGMKASVAFYMRCLEHLRTTRDPSAQELASTFFEQIQARCSENEELVRTKFACTPLILVPAPSPGKSPRWFRARDCLWDGPECFRSRIPLKNIYPEYRKLFRDVLKLRDFLSIDVVYEAQRLDYGDKLSRIKDLFRAIELSLEKDENEDCFDVLCQASVFPVCRLETGLGYNRLAKSRSARDWFIADRDHLESSFRGKVDLLAFSWDEIAKLPLALKKLGALPRKLSKAAKSIPELIGSLAKDERCQQSWREKVEFILRLIPEKEPSRSQVSTQLRNLEVFISDHVVQRWSLATECGEVEGRSSSGQVVLSTNGDILQVYLARGYLDTVRNPEVLVEQLAHFCGIPKEHEFLLNIVLTESRLATIEDAFLRRGIPTLSPDNPFADPKGSDDDWKSASEFPTGGAPSGARATSDFLRSRAAFVADNIGNIFILSAGGPAGVGGSGFGGMPDFFASAAGGFSMPGGQAAYTPPASSAESLNSGDGIAGQAYNFDMGGLRVLAVRNASRTSKNTSRVVFDETLAYDGELFVSTLLERLLGSAYSPEEHWTSKLRIKAGHRPFIALEEMYSTFTLPDGQGRFTELLTRCGHDEAAGWTNSPPMYHLEVKTTAGDITSDFALTNAQFERARRYTIPDSSQGPPTHVHILVRVFNVKREPNLVFLRDPWALYLAGQLQLRADEVYIGQAPPIAV